MNCDVVKADISDTTENSNAKEQNRGRIAYLDALKTFAILLVIEGHVRIIGMGISPNDSLSGMMFYSFDIPIFFFVSGYLAYKVNMSFKEACVNLKNKIYLLVIPAVVFRTALNLIEHRNLLSPLFDGFGKYWFTITLFECFIIYYLILIIIKKKTVINATLILISLVGIALLSTKGHIGPRIFDLGHLCKYFYFFTIGIFAKEYQSLYNKLVINQTIRTFVIIVFFLVLFLMDYSFWPAPIFHLLRDIVLRIMGTFIVVFLFASHEKFFIKSSRFNYIVKEIGRKTLPIYLLQYFFIPSFSANSNWLTGLDMFTIHLISFGYTVFITASCLIFLHLLEQSSFVKRVVLRQK